MAKPTPLKSETAIPGRAAGRRLSIPSITIALLLGLSIAWASGFCYLLVRVFLPSPIPLPLVDGLHLYAGLTSVAFLLANTLTVRRCLTLPGEWGRWAWRSLLVLYPAIWTTGLLLVVPLAPSFANPVRVVHLLSATWSLLPTAWLIWNARQAGLAVVRKFPIVKRPTRLAAFVLILLPLAAIAASPRTISSLSRLGAGSSWTLAGLDGVFLDRMAVSADGHAILAGGDGLYVSTSGGFSWHRVEISRTLVLGMALSRGPNVAYVGTGDGLYAAASLDGPFRKLPFPSFEVHGIAVDPANPRVVWASSRGGFWRSEDGGAHWTSESTGLKQRQGAWAITFFHGQVLGSDGVGVYRWDGVAWQPSSDQAFVASLDVSHDGDRLYASSMGRGLRVFDGQRWTAADQGLAGGHGSGVIHVVSVTALPDGRDYAAMMLDGVGISQDGQNWIRSKSGLPAGAVWRVVANHGTLLAVTDAGVYAYPERVSPVAGLGWWTALALAVLLGSAGGIGLLADSGRPWRRWRVIE
ncbi:MAG: hypothetical protein M3077_03880 [Candidatus Dormibacteraeota bacterium]|nr:hypothetical protein [Candidatus Dormibacteraeota bacterium]